mmetsp:Transcript_6111/g.18777  ORF Transcript_6111/g.18777 Transcript_6111/m.18777 type:complete len:215 (-) Transcript_6111:803-1447(-)
MCLLSDTNLARLALTTSRRTVAEHRGPSQAMSERICRFSKAPPSASAFARPTVEAESSASALEAARGDSSVPPPHAPQAGGHARRWSQRRRTTSSGTPDGGWPWSHAAPEPSGSSHSRKSSSPPGCASAFRSAFGSSASGQGGGASTSWARGGGAVRQATNLSIKRGTSLVLSRARCHRSKCITSAEPALHTIGTGRVAQRSSCSPNAGMWPRE